MKGVKFTNSIDPDEVAHNEPPHLDLHCLPPLFREQLRENIILNFADVNIVVCIFSL